MYFLRHQPQLVLVWNCLKKEKPLAFSEVWCGAVLSSFHFEALFRSGGIGDFGGLSGLWWAADFREVLKQKLLPNGCPERTWLQNDVENVVTLTLTFTIFTITLCIVLNICKCLWNGKFIINSSLPKGKTRFFELVPIIKAFRNSKLPNVPFFWLNRRVPSWYTASSFTAKTEQCHKMAFVPCCFLQVQPKSWKWEYLQKGPHNLLMAPWSSRHTRRFRWIFQVPPKRILWKFLFRTTMNGCPASWGWSFFFFFPIIKTHVSHIMVNSFYSHQPETSPESTWSFEALGFSLGHVAYLGCWKSPRHHVSIVRTNVGEVHREVPSSLWRHLELGTWNPPSPKKQQSKIENLSVGMPMMPFFFCFGVKWQEIPPLMFFSLADRKKRSDPIECSAPFTQRRSLGRIGCFASLGRLDPTRRQHITSLGGWFGWVDLES